MPNVVLNVYKVEKVEFVNKLENGTQIKLENKYSYNVKYSSESNNTCRGEFSVEVYDKNAPEKFYVKADVFGFFTFTPGEFKQKIHVDSFKELFPFAKALITTVTSNAGVPPIIIPSIDIDEQKIYSINIDPGKK